MGEPGRRESAILMALLERYFPNRAEPSPEKQGTPKRPLF